MFAESTGNSPLLETVTCLRHLGSYSPLCWPSSSRNGFRCTLSPSQNRHYGIRAEL